MKDKRPRKVMNREPVHEHGVSLSDIAFGDWLPQIQFDDIDEDWNPIEKKKDYKGRYSSGSTYITKRNSNLRKRIDDSGRNGKD
jgi:hypothetical protein